MPRYKLTLEYDGTGFVGWQYQGDGRSVQEALESAVERFCGEQVRVHGAGRTDSGVHALGQCCHLDLAKQAAPGVLRDALNAHLRPAPVVTVLDAAEACRPTFDARRDAAARVYLYRIVNRKAPLALAHKRAWHLPRPLDVGMPWPRPRVCSKARTTSRPFAPPSARRPRRSVPCRASPSPAAERRSRSVPGRGPSSTTKCARSWELWSRSAKAGATPADIGAALAARDRRLSGPTAPASGLYLEAVIYRPPRR